MVNFTSRGFTSSYDFKLLVRGAQFRKDDHSQEELQYVYIWLCTEHVVHRLIKSVAQTYRDVIHGPQEMRDYPGWIVRKSVFDQLQKGLKVAITGLPGGLLTFLSYFKVFKTNA